MSLVLKDRVKETTSTTGTGTLSLSGAVQGYQSFAAIGNGNTTYYCIQGVSDWEVGIGTYSSGMLTRDTVLASSNNNSLVPFGAGVKDVFCTYPASKSVNKDAGVLFGASNSASGLYATVLAGSGSSAGGDYAIVGAGRLNGASGEAAVIGGGIGNTASGIAGTIAGGDGNSVANYAAIAGGQGNNASGVWSTVAGGYQNLATQTWASVVGGVGNWASGQNAFIGGGSSNIANGNYSTIAGGVYGTTRGITGYQAFPACDSPIASAAGVSQGGLLILAGETTNGTAKVLRSNADTASATNQLSLANNSAVLLSLDLVGWDKTDYLTINGINTLIVRGANAAATVLKSPGYLSYDRSAGSAAWAVAFSADTTNGCLKVQVTGAAGKTIRWVCRINSTEVAF